MTWYTQTDYRKDYNTILNAYGGWDANTGNFYMPISNNPNPLLYIMQTPFFNRRQRWNARFYWYNNPICQSGVNNLTNMVIGEGFKYKCKSKYQQNELDEWMRKVKWKKKHRERFQRLIVDGEGFSRPSTESLTFIDPDFIYDDTYNGIKTNPFNYEEVERYLIDKTWFSKENVPNQSYFTPDEIVHEKLAWSTEKRGISLIYSIMNELTDARDLLNNLIKNCKQLCKITAIRKHQADRSGVETFRDDVKDQCEPTQSNGKNIEDWEAGDIADIPDTIDWIFPGQSINADQYIGVLRAELRIIASRFGLAENVLSQDSDSTAAYNGQLVQNAHISKGLEHWQRIMMDGDYEILERIGFYPDEVQIIAPEVSVVDKSAQVELARFLDDHQLASPQSICKMFDLDYDDEKVNVKKDDREVNNMEDTNAVDRTK